MKKSIVIVVILVALAALLPIVGNSFMKDTIDTRVNELESFGLEVQTQTSQSSYLSSKKHFEFVLQDSAVFVEYLNKYSKQQIPPYVNAALNGVVIGADVEYSNLPFAKAIEIEIYPMSLSKDMADEMRKEDLAFAEYVEKFLGSKGVLYHITYNILNSEFKGFIKDIETAYSFDKDLDVDFKLKGATFSGEGDIIAPHEIKSKIKSFNVSIVNQKKRLDIDIKKLSSKSEFDSINNYETDVKIGKLDAVLSGTKSDVNISLEKLQLEASSDDSKVSTKLASEVSFKKLHIDSPKMSANIKSFMFEISVKGLDKERFEKFRSLSSKNNSNASRQYQKDVQQSLLKLLEKGLVINTKELSVKEIEIAGLDTLEGFDIKTKITLHEDPQLSEKLLKSPLMAMADLEFHTKMKINKKMYSYMMKDPSMMIQLDAYAKRDGENVIFDVDFKDSKLSVNGKVLN